MARTDGDSTLDKTYPAEAAMKEWDLLLEWMTHLGSGAWGAFREAVAELASTDADDEAIIRTLRIALSDLGHVDFFVDGTRRWRVMRPALVGFSEGTYLFVGGRTRSLLDRLREAVASHCIFEVTENISGLSHVRVAGNPEVLSAVAARIGVEYVADAAASLSARLPSVRKVLEASKPAQEPINWSVRSWSFEENRWVNDRLERTVREYRSRHGDMRYLLHAGKPGLLDIDKRTSVYCAALVRGARIVRYCRQNKRLHVPTWAPLPEIYARTACIAGGQLSKLANGEILFENVEPHLASTLLVGLGQGFPMPEEIR
jgi:hypothetical protein